MLSSCDLRCVNAPLTLRSVPAAAAGAVPSAVGAAGATGVGLPMEEDSSKGLAPPAAVPRPFVSSARSTSCASSFRFFSFETQAPTVWRTARSRAVEKGCREVHAWDGLLCRGGVAQAASAAVPFEALHIGYNCPAQLLHAGPIQAESLNARD